VDRLTWQIEQRVHDVDSLIVVVQKFIRVHANHVAAARITICQKYTVRQKNNPLKSCL